MPDGLKISNGQTVFATAVVVVLQQTSSWIHCSSTGYLTMSATSQILLAPESERVLWFAMVGIMTGGVITLISFCYFGYCILKGRLDRRPNLSMAGEAQTIHKLEEASSSLIYHRTAISRHHDSSS